MLDITQISERGGHGSAVPLSERELLRVFGTPTPNRRQVQTRWDDIAETLQRWQACFFVVFDHGQAQDYAFVGCSGD